MKSHFINFKEFICIKVQKNSYLDPKNEHELCTSHPSLVIRIIVTCLTPYHADVPIPGHNYYSTALQACASLHHAIRQYTHKYKTSTWT